MARKADLEAIFAKAVAIFEERHPKYGGKLTREQALALCQLKLDRLITNGDEDSALDLINYAAFVELHRAGDWDKTE